MKPKSPPKAKSLGSDTDDHNEPTSDEQLPIIGKVLCMKCKENLTSIPTAQVRLYSHNGSARYIQAQLLNDAGCSINIAPLSQIQILKKKYTTVKKSKF